MASVGHKVLSAGAVEVFSLGPIWPGVTLIGIWASINTVTTGALDVAFAVCDSQVGDLVGVQAGQPLVQSTDFPVAAIGMPSMRFQLVANNGRELTFPCFVPIVAGAAWIGIAALASVAMNVSFAPVVDGFQVASDRRVPAGAGQRVAQGVGVMAALREAAVSGRGK